MTIESLLRLGSPRGTARRRSHVFDGAILVDFDVLGLRTAPSVSSPRDGRVQRQRQAVARHLDQVVLRLAGRGLKKRRRSRRETARPPSVR